MKSNYRLHQRMRQLACLPFQVMPVSAQPLEAGAPSPLPGPPPELFPLGARNRAGRPRGQQDSGARARRRTPQSWPYAKSEGPAARSGADAARENTTPEANPAPGKFLDGSITNGAGHRSYKLYIPSCYHGQPLPLVVMLHGCKQDPDDFAQGTRMNRIAEEKQCFVLYPAQSGSANRPRCWSWFNVADQERERGEPSLIADTVRQIIRDYRIDESRVYIAGLSAGGAMAVIMATTYPELFAAAAVHSGLPYNAATGLFSALSTMKIGPRYRNASGEAKPDAAVPMIVFHGDADRVVHPRNGEHVVRQAVTALSAAPSDENAGAGVITARVENGAAAHPYTRTVYCDQEGVSVAEQWVIHGAGHAWSGGSSKGSYTDPEGPDATVEMMRFFYERRRAPAEPDLQAAVYANG
jgi:poly(hydroxyalkanoate) depolymerase family esterase